MAAGAPGRSKVRHSASALCSPSFRSPSTTHLYSCLARCPLRKMEEVPQLCSVQWGSSHPLVADLGIPPFHAVEELVMHVVDRLGLGKEDLVVSVVIFERCAKRHRGLLRVCGVRRLFLGCCIIARKTGSDVCLAGPASSSVLCSSRHAPGLLHPSLRYPLPSRTLCSRRSTSSSTGSRSASKTASAQST